MQQLPVVVASQNSKSVDVPLPQESSRCSWPQTTAALLSLQLGWGLWLFPSSYARLGWVPALIVACALAVLTTYSGTLFSRLHEAVPTAALFGDIGYEAAGPKGRCTVYAIIYSLDATRCVILHLAATQSLQHALGPLAPPVWLCGLLVLVLAAVLAQVRALARLSWFFMTGTTAQLVAIGIVLYELLAHPEPTATTQAVAQLSGGRFEPHFVALFSMVFAYGGQFAFTELMADMRVPTHFVRAISVCTAVMTMLYVGVASAGYWSKGAAVSDIVIFSLGASTLARVAAGCILVQALAQYLVNLNVWTHNLLVLLGRRCGHAQSAEAHSASQHGRWRWLGASLFVVAYSWLISMSVPYFSSLVGIVASSTYLVCAYTLPCLFSLKLLGTSMCNLERCCCVLIIPVSLSAAGLYSSVHSLVGSIRSHRSGFGLAG